MHTHHEISIRNPAPDDHKAVISVIPEWWGDRDLRSSVPKLLFHHFCSSSFVAEANGTLCGFLVGFLSHDHSNEGYIHFSGVHPDFRKRYETIGEGFTDYLAAAMKTHAGRQRA